MSATRALLATTIAVAACTFPAVTYREDREPFGASDVDAGSFDADAYADDAASQADAPDAADDAGGTDAPDDGAATDASLDAPVDAACSTPCDCDGDGYRDENAPCLGDDCDDHDRDRHPNQGFLTKIPAPSKNGDYNCDGVVEKQLATSFSCGGIATNCEAQQGFSGDPGCGVAGEFLTCKTVTLACTSGPSKTEYQGCR